MKRATQHRYRLESGPGSRLSAKNGKNWKERVRSGEREMMMGKVVAVGGSVDERRRVVGRGRGKEGRGGGRGWWAGR